MGTGIGRRHWERNWIGNEIEELGGNEMKPFRDKRVAPV